jgi:hypothetical protein
MDPSETDLDLHQWTNHHGENCDGQPAKLPGVGALGGDAPVALWGLTVDNSAPANAQKRDIVAYAGNLPNLHSPL